MLIVDQRADITEVFGQHLFHLHLIGSVARIDIIVLFLSGVAEVYLLNGIEVFRNHHHHLAHSDAQAQRVPASVHHRRFLVGEILGGGQYIGGVKKHQRAEVERVAHRTGLIIYYRMVLERSVRKYLAEVTVGQRGVYFRCRFLHSPYVGGGDVYLLVVKLQQHVLLQT